jgi:hypothetical protein
VAEVEVVLVMVVVVVEAQFVHPIMFEEQFQIVSPFLDVYYHELFISNFHIVKAHQKYPYAPSDDF